MFQHRRSGRRAFNTNGAGPRWKVEDFSGFLIVCLDREVPWGDAERLEELAAHEQLLGLARLLEELGTPPSRPVVKSLPPSKIVDLERRAEQMHPSQSPVQSLTA